MAGWVLFAVAVLLVAVYYMRHPVPQRQKHAGESGLWGRGVRQKPQSRGPWHGVEVMSRDSDDPCPAALAVRGDRFLASEAPSVPLRDCDALSCHCWYEHFDDRRQGDRRAGHNLHDGMMSGLGIKEERRAGRDRRGATDMDDALPT